MMAKVMFIFKTNSWLDLTKSLLIYDHPDRLHFWLDIRCTPIIVVLFSWHQVNFDLWHVPSVAGIEPFSPEEISLAWFLLQVPPPSFFQ